MSTAAIDNAQAAQAGALAGDLDQPAVNGIPRLQSEPPARKDKIKSIQERYAAERTKRLRSDGQKQYIDLSASDKYKRLARDCWVDKDKSPRLELQDGMHTKVFIVGGGFGGLTHAVYLVEAGLKPKDIVIADAAGGFGGTWYWNRYPGLMCDVESYIYLPLLEETDYMPKHKYSYGPEIREHANRIARQWHLENQGAFQQSVKNLQWNEADKRWHIQTTDLKRDTSINLTADFVLITPGLLHNPKLSEFNGLDQYQGHFFHTARWDYNYTGGTSEDSSLTNLQGKKVGIIGTGATAIQIVPHLANWASEVYVFQRTPSAVDRRDQQPTDPEEFETSINTGPDWQWQRTKNFNCFLTNAEPLPAQDMVSDGWTNFPSYAALMGGPRKVDQSTVGDHVATLHAWDAPRQEYVRNRVDRFVRDSNTARKLKPWYAGWCKRPCFHDDYLPTFNKPHVHLVDTDGQGIDEVNETGLKANGQQFDLDCIVFSTGYSLEGGLSPTRRAGITTLGRNGQSLDDKWNMQVATLHGVLTHGFPNLFFSGPTQSCASANFSSCLLQLAKHSAYIISAALQKTESERVVIEPSLEAEEEWSMKIVAGAFAFAGMAGCTPSYFNREGESDNMPMEYKMKAARMGMWSLGMNDYVEVIERWREEGGLNGLEVTAVDVK